MTYPEKSFVTGAKMLNNREVFLFSDALESTARRLFELNLIKGFSSLAVLYEGDFDDFELNREVIEKFTGGQLPFVLFGFTYELKILVDDRYPPEIDAMIQKYGLIEVDWFADESHR